MTEDFYKILGVSRNASSLEIRKAFHRLAKKCHPDCAGEAAKRKFQKIQEAYETLANHDKRSRYDRDRNEKYQRITHPFSDSLIPKKSFQKKICTHHDTPEPLQSRGIQGVFEKRYLQDNSLRIPDVLEVKIPRHVQHSGATISIIIPVEREKPHFWGAIEINRERIPVKFYLPPGLENGDVIALRYSAGLNESIKLKIIFEDF